MIYRMIIRGRVEDIFEAYTKNFIDDYFRVKEVLLDESEICKGFTYEKNISNDKRKDKIRTATVKVLEFARPCRYRVEYTSDRHHRVSGIEMKQISNDMAEILYEVTEDTILTNENGERESVPATNANTVKNASWWMKYQFKYLVNSIELQKKRQKKGKEMISL